MGIYLNPNDDSFYKFVKIGKYVDKIDILKELNLLLDDPTRITNAK
ncbi:MAG: hypothetical protein IJR50_02995 [Treponema sp.]|nr:hypothetical protein [Treponema sp.]